MGGVLSGLFMLGMGSVALFDPAYVTSFFGTHRLTADGRNETRAVYGGYGVLTGLLLLASRGSSKQDGVYLAMAISFLGMASGRLVSLSIDRKVGTWPVVFFGVEVVLAIALLNDKRG